MLSDQKEKCHHPVGAVTIMIIYATKYTRTSLGPTTSL